MVDGASSRLYDVAQRVDQLRTLAEPVVRRAVAELGPALQERAGPASAKLVEALRTRASGSRGMARWSADEAAQHLGFAASDLNADALVEALARQGRLVRSWVKSRRMPEELRGLAAALSENLDLPSTPLLDEASQRTHQPWIEACRPILEAHRNHLAEELVAIAEGGRCTPRDWTSLLVRAVFAADSVEDLVPSLRNDAETQKMSPEALAATMDEELRQPPATIRVLTPVLTDAFTDPAQHSRLLSEGFLVLWLPREPMELHGRLFPRGEIARHDVGHGMAIELQNVARRTGGARPSMRGCGPRCAITMRRWGPRSWRRTSDRPSTDYGTKCSSSGRPPARRKE